jgi:uncharacterized damage-inducible protein DinB
MEDLPPQNLDAWDISNRVNLYLLDAVAEEHLADVSASKGRTVGEQFAHVHNVRLMWLKAADATLLEGLTKIEKAGVTKALLADELARSARAISTLLANGFQSGRIKSFKPHPSAFLGYMIAHEGHHRGQILLTLKQSGHMVDRKVQYGIWEWGVR